MTYRALDLYCGAAGSTRGLQLAGFHVTGVDNRPQPHYCGDAFILGDAIEYCRVHGAEFDLITARRHASIIVRLHLSQSGRGIPT